MRILAIRGQNLASLARSFEVDFASGPLAGVGLFAITGPVGAGKSTLLDALCLPLFDRTPRLSGRGGAPVGDDGQDPAEWLRAHDPRTLLRRDAAHGFAEVDFVGRDGVRYRAHWSVRRARRRADGRVQEQELLLRDLDRDVVVASGRKTDVLAAVQVRLGLDFAQFCRSVLLAQGDFAAFLRAEADDRARLLETLTGADIYRRLSKAAHERARLAAHEVDRVRAQFDAQAPLAAAERAASEAELTQHRAQAAVCRDAIAIASRYVAWHDLAAKHQREESEATVQLQQAQDAQLAAAPRRTALQRRQRAMAVVPRWEVASTAAATAQAAQQAARVAAAAVTAAAARAADAAARLGEAMAATFGPGHDIVPPALVRELPQWEPLLQQWTQAEGELAAVRAELPALAAAMAQAQQLQTTVSADGAAVAAKLLAANEALQRAHVAAEAIDQDALAAQRAALEARREAAAALGRSAAAWQQAVAAAGPPAARGRDLAAAAEAVQRQIAGARARLQDAVAARTAAHRQRDAARAQAAVAALRDHLVPGEPCPLCGAREHAPHEVPADADAAAITQAVAAAEASVQAAEQALAEAVAEGKANERDTQRAQRELAAAAADVAAARRAFATAAGEVVDDVATAVALATARLVATEPERQLLTAAEAAARGLATALQGALRAATAANGDWQHAEQRRREAEQRLRTAVAQHAAAQQREATALGRVADARAALAGACADQPAVVDRVAALGAARGARLRHVHRAATEHDAAVRALAEAQAEQAQAATEVDRATAAAAAAGQALARSLALAEVEAADVAAAAQLGAEALTAEADALQQLEQAVADRRAVLRERVRQRHSHEYHERPSLDAAGAQEALRDAREAFDAAEKQLRDVQVRLHADDLVRRQRDELAPRLAAAEQVQATWQALDDLIGSSTGDAFAVFAQGLTLDLLLVEANRRLAELARRYRLQRNPEARLDFVVVDLDLGGTRRSLQTLSGGETFLVSLALALALATLAAPKSRVETLFLDEGFGTLDAASLEVALGALDSLQATGCQVGVISHVDGIAERIGAQVVVQPEGGGQSRVFAQAR